MAKDTFYFTHDFNARNDSKIKRLLRDYGVAGYGIFWAIIEDLYNNANALPTDYESIAYDLRTDKETVKNIVSNYDLFVVDNETFGSSSVERRLNERAEKSKKAKESAENRWNKHRENANALQPQSDGNAIKEKKGEESKEKDTHIGTADDYAKIEKTGKLISEFIKTYKPKFIAPYVDMWNLFCEKYGTSKVQADTETRKKQIKVRTGEPNFDFTEILKKASEQKYALESSWFNFDFLIKNDTNYMKVLEGKYIQKQEPIKNNQPTKTYKTLE